MHDARRSHRARWRRTSSDIPGIDYNFSQPIRDNVDENISGQQGQIARQDLRRRPGQAAASAPSKTRDVIAKVPGAADVGDRQGERTPQIAVHLDRDALARYDLDLGDVQDYIETAWAVTSRPSCEGERRWRARCGWRSAGRWR